MRFKLKKAKKLVTIKDEDDIRKVLYANDKLKSARLNLTRLSLPPL
ncbi:hypothetical protein [Borrelia duttonii]|uniref:Uncharacterized protein n=1 Tax=Borrelia duttonii (strain Ly) TaxID=412419 RepID=B5RPG9_BORDL|nr:hypothetical protein BDU_8017 [Borrelia duttonii Ly]